MDQLNGFVCLDRLHKSVGHPQRDVEVLQISFVFSMNKFLNVGVITAQHPHLGSPACTRRFHCFTGAIEYAHVADRAGGIGMRPFDQCALWPDRGKIITYPAAPAHSLCCLGQSGIDPGATIDRLGDRIPNRLDKAVNERRL